MKRWLTPIRVLLLLLLVLAGLATASWKGWFDWETWLVAGRNMALLSLGSSLVHGLLLVSKRIRPTRWEHRAITNLILFLLFDPLLVWYAFPLVGALAELAQRLARTKIGPVFNPAALGVLLVSFFGFLPGWWGTSFAPRLDVFAGGMSVSVLLIVPVAGYIAYRYRKLTIALVASAAFGLGYWLLFSRNPTFLLLEGTWAFFVLVMAIEPKTSPVMRSKQIIYGAAVGLGAAIGLRLAVFDAFVAALLVTNGLHAADGWWRGRNV